MKDNFYITTPIYYPSAKPHMGHAYSSIVADFFARLKRIQGHKVFFLTGTDEHGQKIQRAAEKSNKDPLKFCDEISKTFRNLSSLLNLSNDDFIRTTEKRHASAVTNLWNILEKKKKYISQNIQVGIPSLMKLFIMRMKLKILDGKKISKSSGSPVEWVEEESYFFKLSKWQEPLLKFYSENPKFILPESRKNEVISFVKSGLKDLSVSRKSFSWGIKVPSNKDHVIYVWLDALTNYLSALNYPKETEKLYKDFWPANIHIIGKDILRFHAVYWPAFLLAAGIKPPQRVYGHGWILSGDEKMSKSKGNILDPIEIIDIYGLDALRYYLLKEVSFGNDGNISKEKLESCINSDLANNYGNLCQRVILFCEKNIGLKVPEKYNFTNEDLKILNDFKENIENIEKQINDQNINYYVEYVVNQLFKANKYFNDQAPWTKKDDSLRLNTIVFVSLELIRKISILLYPIIPNTSLKVLNIFSMKEKDIKFDTISNNEYLKDKKEIIKLGILFEKIKK